MQGLGTLIILACHCVYDRRTNRIYAEHEEDRPIYEAHLLYALQHLKWRSGTNPLLVISGGPTKKQLFLSESRSMLDLAESMRLTIPDTIALEEYALTTIENILFSLYVYHQQRSAYPESIDFISWSFKYRRVTATLQAINAWQAFGKVWSSLNFFGVGDLFGNGKVKALNKEEEYITALNHGLGAYYATPATQQLMQDRDPFNTRAHRATIYAGYPLP